MVVRALIVLVTLFCPGCCSDVLSYHEDVDIRTARVRQTNYLCCLPIQTRTHNTALTEILLRDVEGDVEPQWQKVNTFYWLIPVSPHWEFHGAVWGIKRFEEAVDTVRFSPEASQKVARSVRTLWDAGNDASWYLLKVYEIAISARENGRDVIELADVEEISEAISTQ